MSRSLVVLSGGHPYEADAFADLLRSFDGWNVTHLVHPEAEHLVAEGSAANADAILFYDMPGYRFENGIVEVQAPSDAFKRALIGRFEAGRGAVAMHHAIAGWAAWPEWSEIIGGRFLYQPGEVRNRHVPDSGYRHDVRYRAKVVARHPLTEGLPSEFEIIDELYLAQIFEDSIEPLIRAEHDFVPSNFYSSAAAVAGRMFDNEGWDHAPGSNCVAWTKQARNANLAYLQFGDGPETYANPHVRKLISNALGFVSQSD